MKLFGERLKELRTGKGLTQKQLAAVMNVSGNAVHAWENDKAYYTTIWESMDITSENADGTTNQDYYKGAEWLEENGHRVMNISFTDDSMYLPLPEAEVTNAPILREPAVEYDFD